MIKVSESTLMTSKEAAVYLGTTRRRLCETVACGWLPYLMLGGGRKYRQSELDALTTILMGTGIDPAKTRIQDVDISLLIARLGDDQPIYQEYLRRKARCA